jgi:hypothetical protein
MGHLGPHLTPSATFGPNQFTGSGAAKALFYIDFGLLLFFLISLTDKK